MRIEVGNPKPYELAAFYHEMGELVMLKVDGVGAAVGGFAKDAHGRLWAWLDTKPGIVAGNGRAVVRAVRRHLEAAGAPVFVHCHADKHPTAERLLTVLGFKPTEEVIDGKRIWVWQN